MDLQIFLILLEDGIANGAIYALLALTMVLVFATTRILFVCQGELVTFAALSFASLQLGITPKIIWLLAILGPAAMVMDVFSAWRDQRFHRLRASAAIYLLFPALVIAATLWLGETKPPVAVQVLLSVAIVTSLGPMLYRIAFQPVANASVRALFVIAIALHFVLQGVGLFLFGAEGFRVDSLVELDANIGGITIKGQAVLVVATLIVLTVALYAFFEFTLLGKALRATAVNRVGARIVGIRTPLAGMLAFTLTALIGAVSGVLDIASTTIYYDSGFLIGLKAVLGAICGGLLSYPIAIVGSLGVGILEAFGAFWASAFTEAVVFCALIPILLWLSITSAPSEEGQEL